MSMDIIAHNSSRDYDAHHRAANQLCLWMDQVVEEYGYHKQEWEHMINMAN